MLVSIASAASVQDAPSSVFANRMDSLLEGHLDVLAVDKLGAFQAVQFDLEGWQGFNDHEMKSTPDGRVALERFRPIVREDVISVNDNHWVVLLHEKQGFQGSSRHHLFRRHSTSGVPASRPLRLPL